ncbi:hypothetical protein [Sedimentitalea arenosa]|uniref:Uncharacterized protein n=1 Tax=Sedimentitalea arenosa TaxID=2798803 RepID=A0A8J7J8F5_9RHOB|nr:hypothetical protein [Arenibacterium arenosum]MBJ6373175.1 hypothetical protein [Arenibacterium arenosum]
MPDYYTQQFSYSETVTKNGVTKNIDGNTYFWGVQGAHNHDKAIAFSKAAMDYLVSTAKWPRNKIEIGKFFSGQSSHKAGKELKWNDKTEKWSK